MMNRGANSDSIPMDLIPEILSRLPAKSVTRFRCVSKPWNSIICRQDFTKLFHTMSSSNPRLLIGVQQLRAVDYQHYVPTMLSFFSSPQPQNHYGKSSLVVAADFHAKFSEDPPCSFSYASGLFFFTKMYDYDEDAVRMICNPSTGQYAILPLDLRKYGNRGGGGLLGFDPIGKQFKVLVFKDSAYEGSVYHIMTLGIEKVRWREIICPSDYGPRSHSSGICIDGVLYYQISFDQIGYFDVRSEIFKFLNVDRDVLRCFRDWINYKGRLCGSDLEYSHDGGFPVKLRMCVLEDVEKGKWSTYAYTLNAENKIVKVNKDIFVAGVTASGEIVLVKNKLNKPFYVFYFNPKTNTLLSVEIQGVGEDGKYQEVYCVVDHVEDLSFDVMKTTYAATTSNVRPPEQSTTTSSVEEHQVRTICTFESVNKFDALYLLENE